MRGTTKSALYKYTYLYLFTFICVEFIEYFEFLHKFGDDVRVSVTLPVPYVGWCLMALSAQKGYIVACEN